MFLPEDDIDFGVNRGYRLNLIYQYIPEYIDYLMGLSNNRFCIDVSKFTSLPTPTPFYTDFKISSAITHVRAKYYGHYKHLGHRLLRILKKGTKDEEWRIIRGKVEQKCNYQVDKRFDTLGVPHNQSIEYVLRILKRLDTHPLHKNFQFSQEAILENTRKVQLGY